MISWCWNLDYSGKIRGMISSNPRPPAQLQMRLMTYRPACVHGIWL